MTAKVFHQSYTTQRPSWFTSDGVSRLGLGLETHLETRFWSLGLEGLRSRLGLGLEGFRSQSRALRLGTLHRLFLWSFARRSSFKKQFKKMIVQYLAVQRGQWLSFLCCYVVCEMEKTICILPGLKFILNSIKMCMHQQARSHVLRFGRAKSIFRGARFLFLLYF